MHGIFFCLVWSLFHENPTFKKFVLAVSEALTGISCAEQLGKIWAYKTE